jgi:hypothetical protein
MVQQLFPVPGDEPMYVTFKDGSRSKILFLALTLEGKRNSLEPVIVHLGEMVLGSEVPNYKGIYGNFTIPAPTLAPT